MRREYGAWLLPSGDLLDVTLVRSHEEVAQAYFDDQGMRSSPSALESALELGWARLVFQSDFVIETTRPLNVRQQAVMHDLIDDMSDVPEVRYIFDTPPQPRAFFHPDQAKICMMGEG